MHLDNQGLYRISCVLLGVLKFLLLGVLKFQVYKGSQESAFIRYTFATWFIWILKLGLREYSNRLVYLLGILNLDALGAPRMIAMTSGQQGCRQIQQVRFGCHGGPPAPSTYWGLLEYLRKKAYPMSWIGLKTYAVTFKFNHSSLSPISEISCLKAYSCAK